MLELDMRTRKALVENLIKRYKRSSKKAKGKLLDEFVATTGFNRCYARRLLRRGHKPGKSSGPGASPLARPGRTKKYTGDIVAALKKVWGIMNFPCGKRLVAAMAEMLRVLEKYRELHPSDQVKAKLKAMSAATADRLLAPERKKLQIKGRSGTKPGSLLKHKIPIRTFADWDDARPGFLQIDLVGHEGGNSRGDFAHTLDATDVATGWTEPVAIRNKAQVWVVEALGDIRRRLPFPVLGVNSDSGSEFINDHLLRYCQTNKLSFTRSRASKKNDNCYVEQKNYTVVRQLVGYYRYDTPEEVSLLNKLYSLARLYDNFFSPQMKLIEKIRVGSKVTKKYDRPKTPYARVLASRHVGDPCKEKLRTQYATLNPAKLQRDILVLKDKLYKLAGAKHSLWKATTVTKEESAYAQAS